MLTVGDTVRVMVSAAAGHVGVLEGVDKKTGGTEGGSWGLVRFRGWRGGDHVRWFPLADLERFEVGDVVWQPVLPGMD